MASRRTLERLKIRLNIELCDRSKDGVLKILLDEAGDYILAYTKRGKKQWLSAFDSVQVQIAVINYGRLGAEGVQSQSEGDVSTSFFGKEDYPYSVTKALNPYRRIKGV